MWQELGKKAARSAAWSAATLMLTLGGGRADAGAPAAVRALPPPAEAQSLETISRSLAAVAQADGRLLLLPEEGATAAISAPFDPHGAVRSAVFGAVTAQMRLPFAKGVWTGVALQPERTLLLEGVAMAVAEADPKTLVELARRTLPWDLIKPPRDRGGEPTTPETAALRARFKAQVLATPGVKLTGMAPLPPSWAKGAGPAFLVATRIKGFPLVLMECDRDPASACRIARQCGLADAGGLAAGDVTGIAVSVARRLVILGDRRRQRLVAFRFDSCLHVPRVFELTLPPRLKALANLAVDADDRLWIATAVPDDYQNASLFYWPPAAW